MAAALDAAAQIFHSSGDRASAMARVARAQAEIGDVAGAATTVAMTLDLAEQAVSDSSDRAELLARLAAALPE